MSKLNKRWELKVHWPFPFFIALQKDSRTRSQLGSWVLLQRLPGPPEQEKIVGSSRLDERRWQTAQRFEWQNGSKLSPRWQLDLAEAAKWRANAFLWSLFQIPVKFMLNKKTKFVWFVGNKISFFARVQQEKLTFSSEVVFYKKSEFLQQKLIFCKKNTQVFIRTRDVMRKLAAAMKITARMSNFSRSQSLKI